MRATAPRRTLRSSVLPGVVLAVCASAAYAGDVVPAAATAGVGADDLVSRVQARAAGPIASTEVVALSGRVGRDDAATLQPARVSNDLAGVSYRLWMSQGRAAVGVGLGALGRVMYPAPSAAAEPGAAPTLTDTTPVVSVAMRYRASERSAVFADASLAQGLAGPRGTGGYSNAKVGVEWESARPELGLEHGRLAVQLDSGYRMSLRIRKSGLGVYLRGRF